jgi:hypothetical protein
LESSGPGPRQHENGEILQLRGKGERNREEEEDKPGGEAEARGIRGCGRSNIQLSFVLSGTQPGLWRSREVLVFFLRWTVVAGPGSSPSHCSLGFVSSARSLVFHAGDRGSRSAGVEWLARESEGSTRKPAERVTAGHERGVEIRRPQPRAGIDVVYCSP